MGWPKNLREQQRQRKRIPQELKATSPGSAQNPSATPGPLGINDSAQFLAQPSQLPPLEIHLELKEIIELNEIIEHGRSGLIRKGAGFAKDQNRPQKVLQLVSSLFMPVGKGVRIRLGSGAKSQRFLKTAFAWGLDPDIGGVSAKGTTRSKCNGRFKRMGADQGKPVTGYVFEGVVGNWIVEYLGGKANIDNLFATIIAHELGHQLGLDHTKAAQNIMFHFGKGSRGERTRWLQLAQKKALKFDQSQVQTMQSLLKKP